MNSINPSVEEVVITEEPRKFSDVVKNETAAIGLEELNRPSKRRRDFMYPTKFKNGFFTPFMCYLGCK